MKYDFYYCVIIIKSGLKKWGHSTVDESLKEGKIVHSLGDYPHIMPLVDYINFEPSETGEEPRLLQVMPLAYKNGSGVKEMLTHSSSDKREKLATDSFRQLLLGLEYLHKKGVVHLDIKADNLLYMKNGILRIADFGRAQQVGEHDQITDMYSLGDIRKFSPEIVALIRKCLGETSQTVESFSGKGADVWAAGLYIWELLEDDTGNLFSTELVPLQEKAVTYTNEIFEELIENINFLKGKYSSSLLNLLRQVLAVDPDIRLKTSQIIRKLSGMSKSERKTAFEEAMTQAANPRATEKQTTETTVSIYSSADPTMYVKKLTQPLPKAYTPAKFYAKQNNDLISGVKQPPTPTNPVADSSPAHLQTNAYTPSDLYTTKKKATPSPSPEQQATVPLFVEPAIHLKGQTIQLSKAYAPADFYGKQRKEN